MIKFYKSVYQVILTIFGPETSFKLFLHCRQQLYNFCSSNITWIHGISYSIGGQMTKIQAQKIHWNLIISLTNLIYFALVIVLFLVGRFSTYLESLEF